jgi:hypothetical protein
MTPNEAERRMIVANLRGALAGGASLTASLEAERRLERKRDDRENAQIELRTDHERRTAAEALFALMDKGEFDLNPDAVNRLNQPR